MKKLLIAVVFMGLLIGPRTWAADMLGCPKGLPKGTIWPRFTFKYIDATEKWNSQKDKMIDIEDGVGVTDKKVYKYDFRLGYGLLHNLDIGVNIKYATSQMEKAAKNGEVTKYDESAFTYLWLSGKYIFLDLPPQGVLDYFKLSFGGTYGFALAKSDKYLLAGLGAGDNQAKVGFLHHGGMFDDLFEFAGHFLYHWRGKASKADGFARSDQEMADTFDYLFKLERDLGDYIGLGAGVAGWVGLQDDKNLLNSSGDSLRPYSNNVHFSLEFFPMGSLDYEKRKIYAQVALPYYTRAITAPDYTLLLGAMWTF